MITNNTNIVADSSGSPAPTIPNLPALFTENEWISILGCVAFAGAIGIEMTPEDGPTHPAMGEALIGTHAILRVLGEQTFDKVAAALSERSARLDKEAGLSTDNP